MRQPLCTLKRLAVAATLASVSTLSLAQTDMSDVAAPPDNPLTNMPAEVIRAPAPSQLTAPVSDVPMPLPKLTPSPAETAAPASDPSPPQPSVSTPQPSVATPSDALSLAPSLPSQTSATPQPLGTPADRSKDAEYRQAMNECSSKSGVELKSCQEMVNSDFRVDPGSIRLSIQ
jgi:hypothetical protein